MTHLRRPLLALALALSVFAPTSAAGRSKVGHVKAYTKKDGTTVAAHDRKAAGKHTTAPKAGTPRKQSTVKPPALSVARDERGRIQRSDAARHAFAQQTGYRKGRPGYVIDHIIPLACGGADAPSNMQWQTIAEGKAKDKTERAGCR